MPMVEILSFRDLDAWKAAMSLVVASYQVAKKLPPTERFELAVQMRRAAVSIPSNVAEGQATGPGGRYRYHVRIALGSWAELMTHLELIKLLTLIPQDGQGFADMGSQLKRTGQLLHGLDRSLKRKQIARSVLGVFLLACFAALLRA
jgi:four helix bundle protein